MPEPCVLALDNVTLVPKPCFREPVCVPSPERRARTCEVLALATRCA